MALQPKQTHDKSLPPPPPAASNVPELDREKVCPFLLRVFPQFGGHHSLEQYGAELPPNELVVYTWPDATLRELTDLVKSAQPAARRQNVRLEFALVYPDARGRNTMRPVGVVNSSRVGPDDLKTLKKLSFQTGDYMDVAIL